MADEVSDALPTAADATRRKLWARLLAGQVMEVYALSYRGLQRDLPQTLGLEVVSADAYVYGRYGVLRTHAQRAEIARALAAEPRWLATGGLPYWVEPFGRRAEAILITARAFAYLSRSPATDPPSALLRGDKPDGLFERHDEQELRAFETNPGILARMNAYDGPISDPSLILSYYLGMRSFLVREFPRKTFVVGREQLKRLRTVRAGQ